MYRGFVIMSLRCRTTAWCALTRRLLQRTQLHMSHNDGVLIMAIDRAALHMMQFSGPAEDTERFFQKWYLVRHFPLTPLPRSCLVCARCHQGRLWSCRAWKALVFKPSDTMLGAPSQRSARRPDMALPPRCIFIAVTAAATVAPVKFGKR